jgi:hypothetical protein
LAWRSTRNQLAFRMEPSSSELRVALRGYCDNLTGQYGFMLALICLVLPPAAFVALPLSATGYVRAKRSTPELLVELPRLALAGVLVSLLGFVEMGVFAAVFWSSRAH